MLLTNLKLDQQAATPLYTQITDAIKKLLYNEQLITGDKLPSVRKLAAALQVSRTTVENAYNQLVADGYLQNEPKRGYFAAALAGLRKRSDAPVTQSIEPPAVRYNFANNYIDPASFPTKLWRRYLNRALKNKDLLSGYGEPQGETALRRTLAKYSSAARGVICTPEQIVIGAGVQSLLQILIDILQPDITGIALEAPGFAQAERLFASHGWQVSHFSTEQLEATLPRLLYVSPSNPYKGRSMSPQQRLALLRWATQQQAYLLEDDYNGEFRYFSRPVSSLQGMSDGSTVIYLGSFSRLLLPSLRISYMVLPPLLLERYRQLGHLYNQTSSTIEQLALADFIDAGALRRHVKRLRKLYSSKNVLLRQALTEIFGSKIIVRAYESGLHLRLAVATSLTAAELAELALQNSVRILPVYDSNGTLPEILLSFAGIQENDIRPALLRLKQAWF